uniref:Uncharacterized protein n=1 Tax=viral metagenome TaxID=1070528 RepID=A0A6M3L4B4_9ZZZZ
MNALVEKMIEESIDFGLDTCPKCGASWKCLEDSLYEGMGSPNYVVALAIIANCDCCQIRFKEEL